MQQAGTDFPIIGADFSGARSDRNTVVARGFLRNGELYVEECQPVSRADLLQLLREALPGSVAALDFPFGVPESFAKVLAGAPRVMADVWDAVAEMEMEQFIAIRDLFVAQHGETKREGDKGHPESYSVLHKVNPNMLPMTLRGMQLLHQLRQLGIAILSLDPPCRQGITVIECMPGASLKGMGLPYKGYKTGRLKESLRRRILDGLTTARPVHLANVEDVRDQCEASHDHLDAVVAALTAAMFLAHPEVVSTPPEDDIYRLEGWIYAYKPQIS